MARRRFLLVLAFGIVLAASAAFAAPPAGFADTQVAPVDDPTALAFTPDGRLLVSSQSGQLRVITNGAQPQLALDLGPAGQNVLCSTSERGLLGVAVDPEFAANNFIYLYYTFKKHPQAPDPCPVQIEDSPDNLVNRVSRFVLPASNVVSPAGETILVDNILRRAVTTTLAICTSVRTTTCTSASATAAATSIRRTAASAATRPRATCTCCRARFCGSPATAASRPTTL
jgi:hypothetical protein